MADALAGLTREHVNRLRGTFGGEVITPGDDAYDDARRVWNALFDRRPALLVRPTSVGDVTGRYANEISDSGPEQTRAIYGEGKLTRLTALKRAWDPDNVFRLNHNIAP